LGHGRISSPLKSASAAQPYSGRRGYGLATIPHNGNNEADQSPVLGRLIQRRDLNNGTDASSFLAVARVRASNISSPSSCL